MCDLEKIIKNKIYVKIALPSDSSLDIVCVKNIARNITGVEIIYVACFKRTSLFIHIQVYIYSHDKCKFEVKL